VTYEGPIVASHSGTIGTCLCGSADHDVRICEEDELFDARKVCDKGGPLHEYVSSTIYDYKLLRGCSPSCYATTAIMQVRTGMSISAIRHADALRRLRSHDRTVTLNLFSEAATAVFYVRAHAMTCPVASGPSSTPKVCLDDMEGWS
jgi:hypothetical protein